MEREQSRLTMVGLAMAGFSLLAMPIAMSKTWPQDEFHDFMLLALIVALSSFVLGIAGFIKTRGEEFGRRAPAVIAIGLGSILSLVYGLIFWLSTPF